MALRRFGSRLRVTLPITIAISVCAAEGVALAQSGVPAKRVSDQGWLRDRRYAEGEGVRLGNLELHPGVGAEVGYDSNWFQRSTKTNALNGPPNFPVRDAALLRVTPSLTLSTLGEARKAAEGQGVPELPPVIFRLGVAGTYREFFGSDEITKQRNMSVNASGRVDVNQGRTWAFGVLAGYDRLIRPNATGDLDSSFNVSIPYGGADVTFRPDRGTFDMSLGYQLHAWLMEDAGGSPYTNLRHEITLKNSWSFRPRTSLFHETNVGILTYPNAGRAITTVTNSAPVRSRLGLNGLITSRFGVLLAAGYGGSFYSLGRASTRQFDSFLAQAEGRYYFSNAEESGPVDGNKLALVPSSLAIGYLRTFETSFLSDYYEVNRVYAGATASISGRALITLSGGVSFMALPPVFLNNRAGGSVQVTNSFTMVRPDVTLFGEYRFSNSFAVNSTLSYVQNSSSQDVPYNATGIPGSLDLNWARFQGFVGARLFL